MFSTSDAACMSLHIILPPETRVPIAVLQGVMHPSLHVHRTSLRICHYLTLSLTLMLTLTLALTPHLLSPGRLRASVVGWQPHWRV